VIALSDAKDFPIVCVGGSASGLDAYTRLPRNLHGMDPAKRPLVQGTLGNGQTL